MSDELKSTKVCYGENVLLMRVDDCIIFGNKDALRRIVEKLEERTEIIHCKDCKWWDRLEEGHPYGYCRACRSGTHTERWEISIYRQNRYDFFCADAEPIEDEVTDENVG